MLYVSDCKDHVVVELDKLDPQSMWKRVNPPWPAGALLEPAGVAVLEDGRLRHSRSRPPPVGGMSRRIVVLRAVLAPDGDIYRLLVATNWRSNRSCRRPIDRRPGNHRLVHCDSAYYDEPAVWSCIGSLGFGVNQICRANGE